MGASVIEGDVAEALRALDALLLRVCDVEERRAEAMRGAERGWDSLRAALRPGAAELAYSVELDERPLCPPHGPAALVRARHSLGLDELEMDVLIVLLAAHLEPRYGRVYGALQDDTAHGFVVERLLHLVLARSPSRSARLAATLAEGGRLFETGLVAPSPGTHPAQLRPVDLPTDVRDAILDLPPPRWIAGLDLGWSPARGPAPRGLAAVVCGPGERTERARRVAGDATTVTVALARAPDATTVRAVWRLAALRGAVPILDASELAPADAHAVAGQVTRLVHAHGGAGVVASRTPAPIPVPHHFARAWLRRAPGAVARRGRSGRRGDGRRDRGAARHQPPPRPGRGSRRLRVRHHSRFRRPVGRGPAAGTRHGAPRASRAHDPDVRRPRPPRHDARRARPARPLHAHA